MNKLEAIIISVNYADFLAITLVKNLKHFDSIIVVTDFNDENTVDVCNTINLDKIILCKTDYFYIKGAKFNKGMGINLGYQYLRHKDWVFNIDADTLLPENFREKFFTEAKNKELAYGARRYDIPTFEEYNDYLSGIKKLEEFTLFRGSGYGFCLGYNYNSAIFQKLLQENIGMAYPFWFPNGSESDWVFRNNWGERAFSPPLHKFPDSHFDKNNDYDTGLYKELDLRVIHLGEVGKNHNERITKEFNG